MILTAEFWELLVEVLELITDNSSVGVDGGSVELTAEMLRCRRKFLELTAETLRCRQECES